MANAGSSVSSNLVKNAVPSCCSFKPTRAKTPLTLSLSSAAGFPQKRMIIRSLENAENQIRFPGYKLLALVNEREPSGPAELPGKTPQEFPSKVPNYQPSPAPQEIPKLPEIEIHPDTPQEVTTIPDPRTDKAVPPLPSPPNPPDNPLPPPGTPRPPPPDTLPPDPPPDMVPPPSSPPNIDPPSTVPPDIQRPSGPFGPVVL